MSAALLWAARLLGWSVPQVRTAGVALAALLSLGAIWWAVGSWKADLRAEGAAEAVREIEAEADAAVRDIRRADDEIQRRDGPSDFDERLRERRGLVASGAVGGDPAAAALDGGGTSADLGGPDRPLPSAGGHGDSDPVRAVGPARDAAAPESLRNRAGFWVAIAAGLSGLIAAGLVWRWRGRRRDRLGRAGNNRASDADRVATEQNGDGGLSDAHGDDARAAAGGLAGPVSTVGGGRGGGEQRGSAGRLGVVDHALNAARIAAGVFFLWSTVALGESLLLRCVWPVGDERIAWRADADRVWSAGQVIKRCGCGFEGIHGRDGDRDFAAHFVEAVGDRSCNLSDKLVGHRVITVDNVYFKVGPGDQRIDVYTTHSGWFSGSITRRLWVLERPAGR